MAGHRTIAALAGMVVAGSALLAVPPAVAASDPGRAYTWGANTSGQLGNNTTTDSSAPVAVDAAGVLAGKTVTAISAGSGHTCAVADGRAYCWGRNTDGQLGNGLTTNAPIPVAAGITGALSGKTITEISAGSSHTCAIADGRAYCWGNNFRGQLGNNTTTDSPIPVGVDTTGPLAGKTVTAISAGGGHTCAIADGQAYCWGYNVYGRLGNNSVDDSTVPVPVDTSGVLAGKTVTAISAGSRHTCAIADGRAYCWGYAARWLGNNSFADSTVPVAADTTGPLARRMVTAISAGYRHTCAIADGRAYCWRDNAYGQLGDNTTTDSPIPVGVDTTGPLAGKTVTAISAGEFHTCAVADGRAYCWGYNAFGRLGNSSTTTSQAPVPVDTTGVLAGRTVTAISAGSVYTAVLAAAVPRQPTGVTATAGNAAATVSWTPPSDDGGSPVMDYTATATPSGATCTTTGTTCQMSGLANGTAYTFTVTARNLVGASTPSAPSAPVTPIAPVTAPAVKAPGKIRKVKVKTRRGKRTVTVTWKRAARATSYRVRISRPTGKKYTKWKKTTKPKRVFKTKLRAGKKYRAQVRAVGRGGRGPITTKRFRAR